MRHVVLTMKSALVLGVVIVLGGAEALNACTNSSFDDGVVSDGGEGNDATLFGPDANGTDSGPSPIVDAGDAGVDSGSIVDSGNPIVDSGPPPPPFDAGPPPIINGCQSFADNTASGVASLDWSFNIENDPNHCALIRPGQSVSWVGDFTTHPLGPYDDRLDGGTTGSPINIGSASGNTTVTINFPTPGIYGYWCQVHMRMMMGAIEVQAPDVDAGDAGDGGT
jgi:hypothetical protein